jgi:hypothetical protein
MFNQAAGVAQWIWCLTADWTTWVRSPVDGKNSSSSLYVQTSSEAHQASYSTGTGDPFPWGKARPGSDADHSAASSAEVKNELELYFLFPLASA